MRSAFGGLCKRVVRQRSTSLLFQTSGRPEGFASAASHGQGAWKGFSTAAINRAGEEAKQYPAGFALAGLAAGGLLYYLTQQGQRSNATHEIPESGRVQVSPSGHPAHPPEERAPSEGPIRLQPFELQTHTGEKFTQDSLLGNYAVLAFGGIKDSERTQTQLARLTDLVQKSDHKSNMHFLNPVLITTDADEAIQLHDYMDQNKDAHVRTIAVHGPDSMKLQDIARVFAKYASAEVAAEGRLPTTQSPDVASLLFVVNPDGEFLSCWGSDVDTNMIAESVAGSCISYKRTHPSWHTTKSVKLRHA